MRPLASRRLATSTVSASKKPTPRRLVIYALVVFFLLSGKIH